MKSGTASCVLVAGSTALDSIKTPVASGARLLGGSASYAAVAASFFAPVKLVGVVGDDFPKSYLTLFKRRGIDLAALEIRPGKTFHWQAEYEPDMNRRRTIKTELGVFETFMPELPETHRTAPFVLLANIAPALQLHVLDQMRKPRFVAADTMDLWLNNALPELLKLLKRVDALILNDSEAQHLAGERNLFKAARKIARLGPKFVIIKKGEHGSFLWDGSHLFLAPAFPLTNVVDPTGAGDTFAGALMGYLASARAPLRVAIRRGMIYGSIVASFCCEGLGLTRAAKLTRTQIERRLSELKRFCQF
ncbi:MAG: PfkB family carbohydrate kinase [Verrucomicrobiae bacterium]|nr:PfkB family carbohydrate kinase [Verrucomicrobiae bacterium]